MADAAIRTLQAADLVGARAMLVHARDERAAGFYERSIHNDIEQFGNIVQVWSTYESRHATGDPTPFARGINSFQLLKDGDRYWVVNIFWDAESPTNPIPAKYLPTNPR